MFKVYKYTRTTLLFITYFTERRNILHTFFLFLIVDLEHVFLLRRCNGTGGIVIGNIDRVTGNLKTSPKIKP